VSWAKKRMHECYVRYENENLFMLDEFIFDSSSIKVTHDFLDEKFTFAHYLHDILRMVP
jgi:hypothetical protein